MSAEIRLARGMDVRIVIDCRIPNGYALDARYVERYLGKVPHSCTPEDPCDARTLDPSPALESKP